MATTTDFIAAIEMGSSKITGILGKKNADNSYRILALASQPATSFIRRGIIYNIDMAQSAIESILKDLELQVNYHITQVYVGIGGQSLRTVLNKVHKEVYEDEEKISQILVDNIRDENYHDVIENIDILDVAPQEFEIDETLYANPVGVTGKKITGVFMNVVARSNLKKGLLASMKQAKKRIADDPIVTPLAEARLLLSEDDRNKGCALVDIGYETTTVSVYTDGLLRYLSVIPLGSHNITRDLASYPIPADIAESLKKQYGDAVEEADEAEKSTVYKFDDEHGIEKEVFDKIVAARTEEILKNVAEQIKLSKCQDKLLAGVFFTGGGTNLKNIDTLFAIITNDKYKKPKIISFPNIKLQGGNKELEKRNKMLEHDGRFCGVLSILAAGKDNCCGESFTPDLFGAPDTQEGTIEFDEPEPEPEREESKKSKGSFFDKLINKVEDSIGKMFEEDNNLEDNKN